ncbi:MAG: InlB B-repeat-containing protein, partial [Bacteroidales bacterium]|nr:InlB B-repeat-containing protein [Bacteroidales bacterium]
MNKARTIISLAVLTIGLLGSCSKINERLDGLDKRINNLENDKIASVEQQIAAINQSIADLGTIRTNIQTLMDAKEAQGEDITTLKAKDQELEGKINDLKAYVDTELAKYATKDWANATFATLAKQAEIIADITKLKQDLAGLDAALDQNIEDLDSSLKVWVNEQLSAYSTTAQMEAKVKALQDQIDALKADNETNKSDIEDLEADLAQLEQDLESAKATIKTAYEKAIKDALESNNGYITEKIKRAISSANGSISSLSSRVGTLETQVEALRGDVDALKEMIQSVTIIPAYSDGSVEAVNGILELNLVVSPSSAAKGLTKDNVKILLNKVATKAVSVGTVKTENISSFIVDVTNGTVEIKANISENLPTEDGQALTVAVNVANGISDFTTEFVPVTVTTKPIETVTFDLNGITGTAPEKQKVAKDGKVTKPTDPTDQVHTFAGWYKTKDATTGAL